MQQKLFNSYAGHGLTLGNASCLPDLLFLWEYAHTGTGKAETKPSGVRQPKISVYKKTNPVPKYSSIRLTVAEQILPNVPLPGHL